MDTLILGDKVVVADVGTYGLSGVGTVFATGTAVGKPVAFVRFPNYPLADGTTAPKVIKLVGFDRYVVNRVGF